MPTSIVSALGSIAGFLGKALQALELACAYHAGQEHQVAADRQAALDKLHAALKAANNAGNAEDAAKRGNF